MDLEYSIGKIDYAGQSLAIKSHRAKHQHPGLTILTSGVNVVWTIVGLQPGSIESGDPTDKDHLDFYVFENQLCLGIAQLPAPTVTPDGGSLHTTFPWGKEGPGKKTIRPGWTRARFQVRSARMQFAHAHCRSRTSGDCFLNIEFELAPYPNPSGGSRQQVHFGVDAAWQTSQHMGLKNHVAYIEMTDQQYARVYNTLIGICQLASDGT